MIWVWTWRAGECLSIPYAQWKCKYCTCHFGTKNRWLSGPSFFFKPSKYTTPTVFARLWLACVTLGDPDAAVSIIFLYFITSVCTSSVMDHEDTDKNEAGDRLEEMENCPDSESDNPGCFLTCHFLSVTLGRSLNFHVTHSFHLYNEDC
jgi:hypothetical protein